MRSDISVSQPISADQPAMQPQRRVSCGLKSCQQVDKGTRASASSRALSKNKLRLPDYDRAY